MTFALDTSAPRSYELGSYVLIFAVLVSLVWIIVYSFNFPFVRKRPRHNVAEVFPSGFRKERGADPGRCFVASIVISLALIGLWWAFF